MQMIPDRLPPAGERGAIAWLRRNLFSGTVNAIVSIALGSFVALSLFNLGRWMLTGASWQPVWNNMKLLAIYRYPAELAWRPIIAVGVLLMLTGLTAALGQRVGKGKIMTGVYFWFGSLAWFLTLVALIAWPSVRVAWLLATLMSVAGYAIGWYVPRVVRAQSWLWAAGLPIVLVLIYGVGGSGSFAVVGTSQWGGFLLTVVIAAFGITVSFPLGIALALGRRSNLPAIKYFSIGFIEVIRGAPLITWLFIASLMVPLLLDVAPDSIPALTRALVAVTLFSAAYMAENVRGGLQSVPNGQREAARALGLSGWQTTRLIVLPQALRAVIPVLVGQAIGLFKDTSLVFIVGLHDFFEIGRRVIPSQPESLLYPGGVLLEISVFMAFAYFFFTYRMSIASRQLEKELGVGER